MQLALRIHVTLALMGRLRQWNDEPNCQRCALVLESSAQTFAVQHAA
jgi:hypothetical protein